jgi:hypothetical protein
MHPEKRSESRRREKVSVRESSGGGHRKRETRNERVHVKRGRFNTRDKGGT